MMSVPGATAPTEPEKPKWICPLDGTVLEEAPDLSRPVVVTIDNNPSARPQTGLNKGRFGL